MMADQHTLSLHRFNEGEGTLAADSSGNGYDAGLIGSPGWITVP